MISKRRLGLDLWPETLEQAKNTRSRINTIWNIKAIYWQKIRKRPDCPLSPIGKKAKYVYALLFFD